MKKKIIVNGGPFLYPSSGLKSFTTNFIAHLSKKLSQYQFEILVPDKVERKNFDLGENCYFTHLPKIKIDPPEFWFLFWDNTSISDYVNKLNHDEIAFFLSTHHAFPLPKLNVPS